MREQFLPIVLISICGLPVKAVASDLAHTTDTVETSLPDVVILSTDSQKGLTSSTPYHNIDATHIKMSGVTDIADAMNRLPGVNLRDYGGAGGLKTVSIRGLGAGHTAVVYDGVALTDCQSGQIDLSRYSLDNVSSLSLYSGDNDDIFMPARAAASASSLYINSFTAPESEDKLMHVNARMRVGAFGYYNPFARVSKRFGKASYSMNMEYIHADNDYPFKLVNGKYVTKERRQNSKMNSWHGELNGRWELGGSSILNAKLYYYDNDRDLPGPVVYYVSKTDEHLRERNFFGQVQYRGKIMPNLSLLATSKFNWAASRYNDYDDKYAGGVLDNYYIQREMYATMAVLFTPVYNLSLDYSADWSWNNLSSNLRKNTRPYRHCVLQSVAAKYRIWRMTMMGRVLYSLYLNDAKDGDAGNNHSRFSPMFSVSLQPIESSEFYLRGSYKNIFRVPTFNELYYDNYGSVNLEPEVTDQFNLGFTWHTVRLPWLSDMSFTCDGYVNHVSNKIVAVPYNLFLWRMSNLGKVRVFGIDVTFETVFPIRRGQEIAATGTYSYQRAQPRTNRNSSEWMKQVAYIPLNSGAFSLSWLNPWVNVALHSTAMSARYTTNNNLPETRIPGFIEAGVSLSHKFLFRNYSVDVRGDLLNMFNTRYEIVARYPMPGRSWKIAVELDI